MVSRSIENDYPGLELRRDVSRAGAINWGVGVALLSFCGYVLGWSILKGFWASLPNWSILLCVPVALILGASWGSLKLIQFTEEYLDYLYAVEVETGQDINGDGIVGDPPMFDRPTLLMGIDGIRHRVDVDLLPSEVDRVKRLLLLSGKATVRALASVVGERASRLRDELIAWGICEQPDRANAAAVLSPPGKKAVMRW